MPRAALSEEQLADFRERAIDAATHLLADKGDKAAGKELKRKRKYITWLKEQVVFTRDRMKLHQ